MRQLYDVKHGARAELGSALMKPVAERLSAHDIVLLAAYAGSLKP